MTVYYLSFRNDEGNELRLHLTGSEFVEATCPGCLCQRMISFDDFLQAVNGGCVTFACCNNCSEERRR